MDRADRTFSTIGKGRGGGPCRLDSADLPAPMVARLSVDERMMLQILLRIIPI